MSLDPTISALDRARQELLRERFEERAAILEFDAGFTRAEAERIARAMCSEILGTCSLVPRDEPNE